MSPGGVMYNEISVPFGTLGIAGDDKFVTGIFFRGSKNAPRNAQSGDGRALVLMSEYLVRYFRGNGDPDDMDIYFIGPDGEERVKSGRVPGKALFLDMRSCTAREVRVYRTLMQCGSGHTISYGRLAEKAGFPRGSRFAGNCMAKNPFPIIIPCHRVIKSDGSMGNYGGGAGVKEFLIRHESRRS